MPPPIQQQILAKLEEIRVLLEQVNASTKWVEKGIYTINLHHEGGAHVELHAPEENP